MSQGSWEARVVASLCASKRRGLTFDMAWAIATSEHKPRAREVATPSVDAGQLFAEDGQAEESVADALYRFSADAWFGRRPTLRMFTLDALRAEPVDAIHDWRSEHRVAA